MIEQHTPLDDLNAGDMFYLNGGFLCSFGRLFCHRGVWKIEFTRLEGNQRGHSKTRETSMIRSIEKVERVRW